MLSNQGFQISLHTFKTTSSSQKLSNRSFRFMTYTLLVRQKYLADGVFYYKTNIT